MANSGEMTVAWEEIGHVCRILFLEVKIIKGHWWKRIFAWMCMDEKGVVYFGSDR